MEPALARAAATHVVVTVVVEGRSGIEERQVSPSEFEAVERGLSMGPILVPWARVFRYETTFHQAIPAGSVDEGSRVMQRVVYQDERGLARTLEVPLDRFENGPHAVTMVGDREVDADRGEIRIRRISIPWHRVIETERIFSVPEARPAAPES
jgi:hypothetical protein